MANTTEGRWITVNGTHILIKNGQTAQEAIAEKFGNSNKTSYKNASADEVKKVKDSIGWRGGYTGENGVKFQAEEDIDEIAYRKMESNGLSFSEAYREYKNEHKNVLKMYKDDGDTEMYTRAEKSYNLVTSLLDKNFKKTSAEVVSDYKASKAKKNTASTNIPKVFKKQGNGYVYEGVNADYHPEKTKSGWSVYVGKNKTLTAKSATDLYKLLRKHEHIDY